MITNIIWVLFYLFCPALILYLCSKNKLLDSVGAIVLCYVLGLIIGNIGIFPEHIASIQDAMNTVVIPLALPLIFFSMNLKSWSRQAGMAAKAFAGALMSVIIASFSMYGIFAPLMGEEAWKMSGMLVGCYTGGTPNLAAIANGLDITSSSYMAVHASDVLVCGVLFLLILSVIPRMLKRILPPFRLLSNEENETNLRKMDGFEPYFRGFRKEDILPLAGAFGLALLIFAVGGGISFLFPDEFASVAAILLITTLGVLASFVPGIRRIRMTFQLGHYLLLVFALVVSSMADIRKLIGTAPMVMLYITALMIVAFVLHTLFSKWMKVDRDSHLISITALVYSPPFVPVVAAVLKNKQVIMTGMLVGIAGWIIGNYAGIGFAYLVRTIFGS
jgi:uncharacterized membrane protein